MRPTSPWAEAMRVIATPANPIGSGNERGHSPTPALPVTAVHGSCPVHAEVVTAVVTVDPRNGAWAPRVPDRADPARTPPVAA